jgi:hypothetical protein
VGELAPGSPETRLDDHVVARSVRCRQCRYDLRGLRAGGQCPECGADIWSTLMQVVDPRVRRLPQLSNPRGVGDALVWLVACLVAAVLLQLARPVAHWLGRFEWVDARTITSFAPRALMLVAGCVVLLGLWSVVRLRPPAKAPDRPGVGRELAAIAAGLVIWSCVSIGVWAADWVDGGFLVGRLLTDAEMRWQTVVHLLGVTAFILIMVGLRRILAVIGERSREYRNARGGRQRILEMNVAAVGVAVGQVLRLIGHERRETPESRILPIEVVGSVMLWICTLMLVIGLLYLLANAWWIRRSLREPPPRLHDLLQPTDAPEGQRSTGAG